MAQAKNIIVSIIVPVYNTLPYLSQCIDSIISQQFHDWECILVDDGSTDGSGGLCDEYKSKDRRITVLHQENKGVSAARNAGIKIANGKFITFVDSDDWIDKTYLMHLADVRDGADLRVSGYRKMYKGKIIKEHKFKHPKSYVLHKTNADTFIDMLKQDLFYVPVSKFYLKSIIDTNQIEFPIECNYGEDLLFNFLYLKHTHLISILPHVDYNYRIQNAGTLTTVYRPDRFENDYMQWNIVKDFCESNSFLTSDAKQYLGQRLWGIIYEGLFLLPSTTWATTKKILSVNEIQLLSLWNVRLQTSKWIKFCVMKRKKILLYILLKLRR